MSRLIYAGLIAIVSASAVVSAQDVERKTKTKITVEDGKSVTVTGCVTRGADGNFLLSNAAGKEGAVGTYILAADDQDDLQDKIGHRVEVKGKAADKGSGKVKMVGFDSGTQSVIDLKNGDIQGLVVQDPVRMGYLGVITLYKHLQGEKVDKRIDTGAKLVTADNMEQPEIKELLHPPLDKYLK